MSYVAKEIARAIQLRKASLHDLKKHEIFGTKKHTKEYKQQLVAHQSALLVVNFLMFKSKKNKNTHDM